MAWWLNTTEWTDNYSFPNGSWRYPHYHRT